MMSALVHQRVAVMAVMAVMAVRVAMIAQRIMVCRPQVCVRVVRVE
jgi:hypothetical protein